MTWNSERQLVLPRFQSHNDEEFVKEMVGFAASYWILKGKHPFIPVHAQIVHLRLEELQQMKTKPLPNSSYERLLKTGIFDNMEITLSLLLEEWSQNGKFKSNPGIVEYGKHLKKWYEEQGGVHSAPLVMALQLPKDNYLERKQIEAGSFANPGWLRDLVSFFKLISEQGFMVSAPIQMDDFLFTSDCHIRWFLNYGALLPSPLPKSQLVSHNMSMFADMLLDFVYTELNSPPWCNSMPYLVVLNRMDQYEDFGNFLDDMEGSHANMQKRREIGVFVDAANLFTTMGNIRIRFNALFHQLYGKNETDGIIAKHAVLFQPESPYAYKREISKRRLQEWEVYFKESGFEVTRAWNGEEKAKQQIDGVTVDADDQLLADLMMKRIKIFKEILLFSGDQDLFPTVDAYLREGVQVTIIAPGPEETSHLFKTNVPVHYITDFPDCLYFI